MSLPEVQLWKALRRASMAKLRVRRQHPIGPYVLDVYAPVAKLAIEIDGAAHDIPDRAARDVMRDAWLAEQGIRVLRFNAMDVIDAKRRDDVLMTIASVACGEA